MTFGIDQLKELWQPKWGETGGQITIIGGSELFTGAPLMSLVAASRLVDMVFLSTPEEDKHIINKEKLFEVLRAVIWVPREEVEAYIAKSDAVLIGPGLMRYRKEDSKYTQEGVGADEVGKQTKNLTEKLLGKFSTKKWVIDGGSLQVIRPEVIPPGAVVTPNMAEFKMLFGQEYAPERVVEMAKKYQCVVVGKNHSGLTIVSDGNQRWEIEGGNPGLSRGGVGDVLAGIIVGLAARNTPLLAAVAGVFLVKQAADKLYDEVGYGYNADDLAKETYITYKSYL